MTKRSQTEWSKLAAEYKENGLVQEEWCKKHNINLYTFRDRLSKMKQNGASAELEAKAGNKALTPPTKEPKCVKVVEWLPIITGVEPKFGLTPVIQVKVSRFTISIQPEFDKAAFTEVCKVLISLC